MQAQTPDFVKVDLTSQAFMRDPFPTLARLREAGPVVKIPLPILGKVWAATTHEAVSEVLKDDQTFVREAKNAGRRDFSVLYWFMPRVVRAVAENMLMYDKPEHHRLRRLVDQAFSRQSVEGMRQRIGAICDGLLDGMAGQGAVDLLESYAQPIPVTVISELLGLPEEDRPRFKQWVHSMISTLSVVGIARSVLVAQRLIGYFRRHIAHCRRHPRPGLMTALVQAEHEGDRLTEQELLAMAFLLLAAGFETTVHLIGGSVLALLQHPEQKARLLADWSLCPAAVEEMLRFVCPVHIAKHRLVSRDLEFFGRQLRRGEFIIPVLASANADPARYDHPEQLDITRSPNPQLTFGTGIHVCLGANLARVETQIALQRLFSRYPQLSLAVPESALRYGGRLGLRALKALPVRPGPAG